MSMEVIEELLTRLTREAEEYGRLACQNTTLLNENSRLETLVQKLQYDLDQARATRPTPTTQDWATLLNYGRNPGNNKIQAIKVVRMLTNLSLKEAKDIVEGAAYVANGTLPPPLSDDRLPF